MPEPINYIIVDPFILLSSGVIDTGNEVKLAVGFTFAVSVVSA